MSNTPTRIKLNSGTKKNSSSDEYIKYLGRNQEERVGGIKQHQMKDARQLGLLEYHSDHFLIENRGTVLWQPLMINVYNFKNLIQRATYQ